MHQVEAWPPITKIEKPGPYQKNPLLLLRWSGTDPGGSGISSYTLGYVDRTDNTPVIPWLIETDLTEAPFTGTPGHEYSFLIASVDRARNVEIGHADANVTFYSSALSGTAYDNAGVSFPANMETVPPIIGFERGAEGSYRAYFATPGTYSVKWTGGWLDGAKHSLPPTQIDLTHDATLDGYVPPEQEHVYQGECTALFNY